MMDEKQLQLSMDTCNSRGTSFSFYFEPVVAFCDLGTGSLIDYEKSYKKLLDSDFLWGPVSDICVQTWLSHWFK